MGFATAKRGSRTDGVAAAQESISKAYRGESHSKVRELQVGLLMFAQELSGLRIHLQAPRL